MAARELGRSAIACEQMVRHIPAMADDLYPTSLLRRAAQISHLGALAQPDGRALKRSMVCGSEVEVSVALDALGRIAKLGLEVEACALGQASASIFAAHAVGADLEELRSARDALEAMLAANGVAPTGRFADLVELEGVKPYPRRHASTLLAWRAGVAAMEDALAR